MSVFQFIVNLIITVVGCALVSAVFGYFDVPLEGLIVLGFFVVVAVLTFSQNAAARLGVS